MKTRKLAKNRKRKGVGRRVGEFLDSCIEPLFPTVASKRRLRRSMGDLAEMRLQQLSNGYFDGGNDDRLRGDSWISSGASPDAGLESQHETIQKRCHELYRNNSIAHSAVESRVTYEVGEGIVCQSKVRPAESISSELSKTLRKEIEEGLKQWSIGGVDLRRRMTLGQLQRLINRTFSIYGEVFIEIGESPYTGPIATSVNVIDPRRVQTPPDKYDDDNCRLGIQYLENGQIHGYWVMVDHPGDDSVLSDFEFVPRFENGRPRMLHGFEELVPEQSRGFPWLGAAMTEMKDLEDYREAELINKQVEACFGLLIKKNQTFGSPFEAAEGAASETDSNSNRLEDLQPGMIHYLENGEEVVPVDPNRPGNTYAPFVESALRSIAGALNMPYEILAKNFFRTTYSSGRLGMLDGRMGFRMRASMMIEQLMTPLYGVVVEELAWMGRLSVLHSEFEANRNEYLRHCWIGRATGFIDPEKEISAYIDGNEADMIPLSDVYAETSSVDWEDGLQQIYLENERKLEMEIQLRVLRKSLEEKHNLVVSDNQKEEEDPDNPKPGRNRSEDSDSQDEKEQQRSAA